jgi:hypothetical protein
MSSIVVAGDTSGTITIAAPAVAGSGTLTLPVATDTLAGIAATQTLTNKTLTSPTITGATITVAATAAPAFSAYQSSSQSISGATNTKIQFQTETFDTNNNFDNTTNYRFTPTVAGYYQFNAGVSVGGAVQYQQCNIYKNGSLASLGIDATVSQSAVSGLFYMNGSTDYVEAYIYSTNAKTIDSIASRTYFSGAMVRSA